jgi:hypothetical protein
MSYLLPAYKTEAYIKQKNENRKNPTKPNKNLQNLVIKTK